MKRPKGFTFIALICFWTSFASITFNYGFEKRGNIVLLSSIILSITSLVAGISIWRCKLWATKAISVFIFIALINLTVYKFTYNIGTLRFWIIQLFVGLLFGILAVKSIKKELKKLYLPIQKEVIREGIEDVHKSIKE